MNLIPVLSILAALYSCVAAWSATGELKWWSNGIIYQVYPRSFKDSNGDGVGDLNGIISKLDYLKDIGVSAVWLSPIYPSPQVDAGYDISNFTDVNPEYGTLNDLDTLVKKSEELGLKVVLDLVPNHSSNLHPWFIKSENNDPKYKDYYVWRDSYRGGEPNNWVSNFHGSAWTWSDKRRQYYLHQFAKEQPDLNYRNPAVVQEMKDVMRFWLSRGVHGFRVDAVPFLYEDTSFKDEPVSGETSDKLDFKYLNHIYTQNLNETYDMVTQWRKVVEEFGKDKFLMTECYANFNQTIDYYGTKEKPGAHFPFNFLAITNLTRESSPQEWKEVIDAWMAKMDDSRWPNWVIGNHDNNRVAARYGTDLADGINMISLTLPGTAMTYNGEEIGMEDTFIPWERSKDPIAINKGKDLYLNVTRDPERTPMQWDDSTSAGFSTNASTWLPVNPNYWRLNVAAQTASARSSLKLYKELAKLRKEQTMMRGNYEAVVDGQVLIITRTLDGNATFATAVNLGDENARVALKNVPELYVHLTSMNAGNIATGSKVRWPLLLRPKAAVLFSTIYSAASRFSGSVAAVAVVLSVYFVVNNV